MKFTTILMILCCYHPVSATSCKPLSEHIFALCDEQSCHQMFYVIEQSYGDICSRRPLLKPVPVWAKEVIEYEAQSSPRKETNAVYQLSIMRRPYFITDINPDLDEYIQKRKNNNTYGLIKLLTYSAKQYPNLKFKWQIIEQLEFLRMLINYLFSVGFIILIALTQQLFFSGLEKSKYSLMALSFGLYITQFFLVFLFGGLYFNLYLVMHFFILVMIILNVLIMSFLTLKKIWHNNN